MQEGVGATHCVCIGFGAEGVADVYFASGGNFALRTGTDNSGRGGFAEAGVE